MDSYTGISALMEGLPLVQSKDWVGTSCYMMDLLQVLVVRLHLASWPPRSPPPPLRRRGLTVYYQLIICIYCPVFLPWRSCPSSGSRGSRRGCVCCAVCWTPWEARTRRGRQVRRAGAWRGDTTDRCTGSWVPALISTDRPAGGTTTPWSCWAAATTRFPPRREQLLGFPRPAAPRNYAPRVKTGRAAALWPRALNTLQKRSRYRSARRTGWSGTIRTTTRTRRPTTTRITTTTTPTSGPGPGRNPDTATVLGTTSMVREYTLVNTNMVRIHTSYLQHGKNTH